MADLPDMSNVPSAVVAPKSGRSLQLVWLIPLLAALVGGWLAVKSIMDRGPVITISFATADGLEAGKTKLRYKDVEMGLVTSVVLAPDTSHVLVTAELVKEAKRYLVEDTRFWVVRARISGGTVTGLGTLLSGSYIGMDIGQSGKAQEKFVGLEKQPIITSDEAGRTFVLRGGNAGSMDVGTPVFFRRLQVGQIMSYELDKNGKGITTKVFVNAPYDRFVNDNTRFWQASGIDVTMDANGIRLTTQSFVSVLIGGLAFESPPESADLPPAGVNTEFSLFRSRTQALRDPETDVMKLAMTFNESVRGLSLGAQIDFRGIAFGQVTAISPVLDSANRRFNVRVEANIYPQRMRPRGAAAGVATNDQRRALIDGMVARGLRAQLRSGNLLTGQLIVALDFFPAAAKVKAGPIAKLAADALLEIPTMPSSLLEIQETIASIAAKVKTIPIDEVAVDLRQTLQWATRMMQQVDAEIMPDARATLVDVRNALVDVRGALVEARKAMSSAEQALKPESPLSQDAREAMREIARAAAAFRVLADYLDRHPEALLGGKKEEKK